MIYADNVEQAAQSYGFVGRTWRNIFDGTDVFRGPSTSGGYFVPGLEKEGRRYVQRQSDDGYFVELTANWPGRLLVHPGCWYLDVTNVASGSRARIGRWVYRERSYPKDTVYVWPLETGLHKVIEFDAHMHPLPCAECPDPLQGLE